MSILKNYQADKATCKVTFSFPVKAAEGVKTVQVLGDFNNWDIKSAPKMKAGKEELTTIIELESGKSYEYKYLLDGTKWENDYNSDSYVSSPFAGSSNSVLVLDKVAKETPNVKPAAKVNSAKTVSNVKPATVKAPAVKKAPVKVVAKVAQAEKVVVKSKVAVKPAAKKSK